MKLTTEVIEIAKNCSSAEELLVLAERNEIKMTAEQAKQYFSYLNPNTGELSDDELDNVSGGGCETSVDDENKIVVSSGCKCFTGQFALNYNPALFEHVELARLGGNYYPVCANLTYHPLYTTDNEGLRAMWSEFAGNGCCGVCRYLGFKAGLGYCTKS